MTQAVTFDDVWKMFQETDRKFQEMVREDRERRAELDRKFQETDRKIQETGQQIKEVSVQMRETDRQMQETDRKMQETDRKMQETDRKMQETDRKIKEVSTQIGRLGGRLGEFVEGLVAPACETLFAERGIPIHIVSPHVKAKLDGGRHMEIDLLVINTDTVSLVEVKSKLTVEDVQDHIKQMEEFKEFFPEYANKKAIGAVAGMVVDESVIHFAIKRGLFVMVQSGDSVRIANDETFVPRTW
ncbi:MAG: hypothetical protein HQL77_15900 [Magnetococcales bacterium]|nr:hypothetical protein [Magnetococcales bacterium]